MSKFYSTIKYTTDAEKQKSKGTNTILARVLKNSPKTSHRGKIFHKFNNFFWFSEKITILRKITIYLRLISLLNNFKYFIWAKSIYDYKV